MEPHIVMAVMGALVGATVGQLKGKAITQKVSRYLRGRLPRLLKPFNQSDIGDETVN